MRHARDERDQGIRNLQLILEVNIGMEHSRAHPELIQAFLVISEYQVVCSEVQRAGSGGPLAAAPYTFYLLSGE